MSYPLLHPELSADRPSGDHIFYASPAGTGEDFCLGCNTDLQGAGEDGGRCPEPITDAEATRLARWLDGDGEL